MKNTRQMVDTTKIRTKSLSLKVKSNNPFEGDALDREELCKKWTNFIVQSTTPYVMAIDGRWGYGKTTLLRMWEAYLKNNDFKCVFFDAWKADFYDSALPALIGEIKDEIERQIEALEHSTEKAKELINTFRTWEVASKTVVALSRELPAGGKIIDALSQTAKEAWGNHDSVEHYLQYKKALEKFKKTLEAFASNGVNGKPLVILVDELDRCRPDFALDLLEKVKHVFDVESVFFIFAINKEGMEKTIKTVYGRIDTASYLRKFFDLTINLINKGHLGGHALAKSGLKEHLQKRRRWLKDRGYQKEEESFPFERDWNMIIKHFDLSPRDEEQILSILNISFHTIPNDEMTYPLILAYFAALKVVKPDLFRECKTSLHSEDRIPFPYGKIIDFCHEKSGLNNDDQQLCKFLHAIRYRHDEEYQRSIDGSAQGPSNDDEALFSREVKEMSDTYFERNYITSTANLMDFFETLDSISGFVFDADREDR